VTEDRTSLDIPGKFANMSSTLSPPRMVSGRRQQFTPEGLPVVRNTAFAV
jgi:hypothetical protein